ncbi:MAG: hypothetical protein JXX14_09110 [Deltaproteobacteria bacterium]|nr:hypothetical protein [Deltaproteobacteria bacterium]
MKLESKQLIFKGIRFCALTAALLLSGAWLSGCDAGTDSNFDGDGPDNNGLETFAVEFEAPPCMATFSESYTVRDMFDDVEYSISKGDTLVIKELDGFFDEATVYYLNAAGPYELTIEKNDAGAYPFETDCIDDNSRNYMGVFADTTIYSDEDLSSELCTVSAGDAIASSGYGFSLVSNLSNGDSVYELTSNAIVAECGAETGYVVAPKVEIFKNQITWLIPIATYLGKNE